MSVTMVPESVPAPRETNSAPPRFAFLDGIRAFAALYVLLHHSSQELIYRASAHPLPTRWVALLRPMDFGHYAVDVFIVVSGFCLMLPVARSRDMQIQGGVRRYIKRRARRILPPYYAAFLVSVGVVCLRILAFGGPHEHPLSSVMNARVWLSHLFVLQNLDPISCGAVDPPLWSVGTEWQIYFIFPLLLLPLCRKWGLVTAVVCGTAIGLALAVAFPWPSFLACPWFIGLFAMGMAGALITARWEAAAQPQIRPFRWWASTVALMVCFLAAGVVARGWFQQHRWIADVVVGIATCCFVQAIVATKVVGKRTAITAGLESRYAIAAGAFSYSIYLVHYPLLQLAHAALVKADSLAVTRVVSMLVVVPVLIVALAYLFHLLVERPFMPGQGRAR